MGIKYECISAQTARELVTSLNDAEKVYRIRRIKIFPPTEYSGWVAIIDYVGKLVEDDE